MINEDYCSFEVAKLLKEKGFGIKEETRGYYPIKGDATDRLMFGAEYHHNTSQVQIAAPTHQMAMKWLREEYNIFIQISAVLQDQPFGLHYKPSIQDYHAYARHDNFSEYITYEEAVEAALKYVLENLI